MGDEKEDSAMKETQSFLIVDAAIKAILKNAAPEFAWHELKKYRLPFVSKSIQKLGERVLEI